MSKKKTNKEKEPKEISVDGFISKVKEYLAIKDNKKHSNHRYLSWEHCYAIFNTSSLKTSSDILALHLAFYLASWGMYRGSSFLLQRDYKIHIPVIEILKKYSQEFRSLPFEQLYSCELIDNLYNELNSYLSELKQSVYVTHTNKSNNIISDTLITKIIMGTIGCVPAYDRYFKEGINIYGHSLNIDKKAYSKESINQLVKFYLANKDKFEELRQGLKVDNISELIYPPMKIIDMGFWQLGYELDLKDETN